MQTKRGVSLIEAVLFIVIALALMIGGIVFFQQASESSRVNDAVRSIVSLQSGVRQTFQDQAGFGVDGADLVPVVVGSGSFPAAMLKSDGTLTNQWGGGVDVRGYREAFVVSYNGLPEGACIRMAPYSAEGAGVAGTGIASLAINGKIADADGNGSVTPEEATGACDDADLSVARWAFTHSAGGDVDMAQIESMLGVADPGSPNPPNPTNPTTPTNPAPTETGRSTDTESEVCAAGFTGEQTRTRETVAYSNGTSVIGEWTEWNLDNCVPVVETGRSTVSESQVCETGFTGQQTRSREDVTYSDGTVVPGAWTGWDTANCVAAPTGPTVQFLEFQDTVLVRCGNGEIGSIDRQRGIKMVNGVRVEVGDWDERVQECSSSSTVIFNTYRACPDNSYGQQLNRSYWYPDSNGGEPTFQQLNGWRPTSSC